MAHEMTDGTADQVLKLMWGLVPTGNEALGSVPNANWRAFGHLSAALDEILTHLGIPQEKMEECKDDLLGGLSTEGRDTRDVLRKFTPEKRT